MRFTSTITDRFIVSEGTFVNSVPDQPIFASKASDASETRSDSFAR